MSDGYDSNHTGRTVRGSNSTKQPKVGDRKCLPKPRNSLAGHPDAILFLRISREDFFNTHA